MLASPCHPSMKQNSIRSLGSTTGLILSALAFALVLGSIRVSAADALKSAGDSPPSAAAPLRVGVSPVFPPMVFKQGRELVGVEVDLARALGEHLGRKIVFVEVPWPDQLEALNAGKTDIIMSSMSITTARRHTMDFSRSYLTVGQMGLVRREDKKQYAFGYPSEPSRPVGVLKATTGEFVVQRDFPKAKRKVFTSSADAVQALLKKKIDFFITDSTIVWYLAGTHAADGLSAVTIALSEEQLGWATRKGDDTLLEAVNSFIQKASQDGTFKRIGRRWMAVEPGEN